MLIATVDGGTTNTRVRIWRETGGEFTLAGEAVSETGVRNTAIDGNNHRLLATVDALLHQAEEATVRFGKGEGSVSLIVASGMLTSDLGLAEIPHIAAPVDLSVLAQAMVCRKLPELGNRTVWFIPGIKNRPDENWTEETLPRMDMMRGEETEAAGLLTESLLSYTRAGRNSFSESRAEAGQASHRILVLPGSHNKYIAVDTAGRIRGCFTTLAGELLRSLTLDSILAGSVAKGFAAEFAAAPFLRGADWGCKMGVGHGAFLCRICALFDHYSPLQAQNYLLGLLLADEFAALRQEPLFASALADKATCFIVAGRRVMQQAYTCLLEQEGYRVVPVPPELQYVLSGKGALALARLRGLI